MVDNEKVREREGREEFYRGPGMSWPGDMMCWEGNSKFRGM